MKPPSMNEFFIRGIPLAVALDLLKRWDSLTSEELARWGFSKPKLNS